MSVEINDQKLIDIVYVDDEGNKHKYSGPFINDLTITDEIQTKLNSITTLGNQISELKTKLDTLNNTVNTPGSKIKYTSDLTHYEDDPSIVTIMTPTDTLIIDIWQDTTSIGWVDFGKLLKSNSKSLYLGLSSNILSDEIALKFIGDWTSIQSYVPTGLEDIASIIINGFTMYENYNSTGAIAYPSSVEGDNIITISDNSGSTYVIYFYLGFKPGE